MTSSKSTRPFLMLFFSILEITTCHGILTVCCLVLSLSQSLLDFHTLILSLSLSLEAAHSHSVVCALNSLSLKASLKLKKSFKLMQQQNKTKRNETSERQKKNRWQKKGRVVIFLWVFLQIQIKHLWGARNLILHLIMRTNNFILKFWSHYKRHLKIFICTCK